VSAVNRLRRIIPFHPINKLSRRVNDKTQQTNKYVAYSSNYNSSCKIASLGIPRDPIGDINSGIPLIMSAKALNLRPKRAPYFYHFRSERKALAICENTHSSQFTYAEYRANRFLYYVVYPHLLKTLWFEPDRARAVVVGEDLFQQLLSYRFKRSGAKGISPKREIHPWQFVRQSRPLEMVPA
jgi:hypothetical protein